VQHYSGKASPQWLIVALAHISHVLGFDYVSILESQGIGMYVCKIVLKRPDSSDIGRDSDSLVGQHLGYGKCFEAWFQSA
jgi:hypothetical protein